MKFHSHYQKHKNVSYQPKYDNFVALFNSLIALWINDKIMKLFIYSNGDSHFLYMDVNVFFFLQKSQDMSVVFEKKTHNHAPITPLLHKPNKGYILPSYLKKTWKKMYTVIKRCQEETNPEELGYVFFNGPVSFSLGDVPLLMYPCHLFTIFTHRNGVIETFDSWLFDFARGVWGNSFNNF